MSASVHIRGNVGKNPEQKTFGTTTVTEFSVAVSQYNGSGKDRSTVWFNVVLFGKQGDYAMQNLQKGNTVIVRGAFLLEEWEKDGAKHSKLKVKADEVESLEYLRGKSDAPTHSAPASRPPASTHKAMPGGAVEDELPFDF